ncbi:MAG: ABC transporter substrate-binding protein [Acidisphaera sp.]|nr:ABC transporter substrate-binding protein [Acidisphaera sp.]
MHELTIGAVSRNYFNMPLWVAQHRGFFQTEGLSVRIELIEGIDEVTQGLLSGDFQLILGVTEHVILDVERGGRSKIIGGNVNRLPFSLIARPHIRTYQDLRGARIGVSSIEAGSSSLIMRLLEREGLQNPEDYTLVAVGPILARWRMLQSGEIDAGLQGAPLNAIAVDAGFSDLGNPRDVFPDFQFTSLHVDGDWAGANEAVLRAFLRAFLRAHRFFFTDKAACTAIAVAETGVEPRYAERAWDEFTADAIFPRDARASAAAVQTLIEVSGLIRRLPNRLKASPADYIDHSWLEMAESDLGR